MIFFVNPTNSQGEIVNGVQGVDIQGFFLGEIDHGTPKERHLESLGASPDNFENVYPLKSLCWHLRMK
jgi:hypothetical protein